MVHEGVWEPYWLPPEGIRGVPEIEESEALGGEHVVELRTAVAHPLHHLIGVCVTPLCLSICFLETAQHMLPGDSVLINMLVVIIN